MAKLAFFGHPKRGSEIIQILQMLGGKGVGYGGYGTDFYYYIDEYGNISISTKSDEFKEYKVFTLEEFLEKYPYKVGERVFIKCKNREAIVYEINWCCDTITYWLKYDGFIVGNWSAEELQPYKEETMEEKENSVVVNIEHKQLKVNSLRFDKTQLVINDEYELKQEKDVYYIVRKKSQYPKTYKECCDVLGINTMGNDAQGYKGYLIIRFQELVIARDAYWKIAGKEMGLDKPWEPKHEYDEEIIFIYCDRVNGINKGQGFPTDNFCLVFPTAEMRDAFYENFKDLIEQCKELL